MLMMVDPDVHFHVIPRYGEMRDFDGVTFVDRGWPAQPDLGAPHDLDDGRFARLAAHVAGHWPD